MARYGHDCPKCVPLGEFEKYDLYYCPQHGIPTVIARYGNEGPDYLSGMPSAEAGVPALAEALNRAVSLGLAGRKEGIRARVHSDDWLYSVDFDATAWFEQAGDKEIRALAACGWGGDYPADDVARFYEELNTDIAALLDYCRRKKDIGFECRVAEGDARGWLERNRHGFKLEEK